jgi:hypothetical protein
MGKELSHTIATANKTWAGQYCWPRRSATGSLCKKRDPSKQAALKRKPPKKPATSAGAACVRYGRGQCAACDQWASPLHGSVCGKCCLWCNGETPARAALPGSIRVKYRKEHTYALYLNYGEYGKAC